MDTSINNEKTFDFEGAILSETELYEFKQKVQEKINNVQKILDAPSTGESYKQPLKSMQENLKNLYKKLTNIDKE
jgi:hypothetical protein